MLAIRTRHLTKRFGRIPAVEELDLEVPEGQVYGFVGPNGSGKTTTIAMLLGLMRPTYGHIQLLGARPGDRRFPAVLRRVGALVQGPAFYPFLSARDNLQMLGSQWRRLERREIDAVLDRVGLLERAADPYHTFSLGMRQRLALAVALLDEPRLIVLDEPTNGLDPLGIHEVRALIRRLGAQGLTVFLSSHLLHEVEQVCDQVGVIVRGRLVAQGPVERLLRSRGLFFRVATLDLAAGGENAAAERARRIAAGLAWVAASDVRDGGVWVQAPVERAAELTRELARHGLWVAELRAERSSLEQYFVETVARQETAGEVVALPGEARPHG